MVSSNKILTVSYGTFSCTLEGFDNSFDTMKAIAEYFRDLAQDDRYFGAEPPTPDAEMLARIAEREIARRVEARFEKGNLVLRPSDEAEPPRGDVAPEPSSGAGLVGAAAGLAATSPAVADTWDDDLADMTDAADTAVEEDAPPETAAADPDLQSEVEAEPVTPPPAAPADSVADKLQRIRAVVANKGQSEPEYIEDEHAMFGVDGDGEDENNEIEPTYDYASDPVAAQDDTPEAAPENDLTGTDDNLFTDTIAALVSDQIDEDDEDDAFLPDLSDEEEDDDFATDPQSEIDALRAKIAELEAQAAEAKGVVPVQTDEDDAEDDTSPRLDTVDSDDDPDVDLALDEAEDETDEQTVAPIVARVTKVKRSDVEAAIAAGDIEEYEDAPEEADDQPTAVTSDTGKLTAEEEAELARELAELQAEIDGDEDWDFDVPAEPRAEDGREEDEGPEEQVASLSEEDEIAAESNIRKAVKLTSPARAMLTETSIEEDDNSVDRLIDQTETEMDEPEGNRRRSAIAHLRAAVAATKADRLLGLGKKQVDEEEPYREDLADAVRPRRPRITQARSERPAPARPAPLKLVAEQRVDVAPADAAPVRPRRVMRSVDTLDAQDEATVGDDRGFAEFAEKAGAHTLPELLEAAAAYMSFVEGRDQFSRPQLMTKLHQTEGAASSREERLRSFGQLLREGKIEKTGGGRFTASDSIGFKPDKRAAG